MAGRHTFLLIILMKFSTSMHYMSDKDFVPELKFSVLELKDLEMVPCGHDGQGFQAVSGDLTCPRWLHGGPAALAP